MQIRHFFSFPKARATNHTYALVFRRGVESGSESPQGEREGEREFFRRGEDEDEDEDEEEGRRR
jgi:hypothetical protein